MPAKLLDAISVFHMSECTEASPHELGDPLEASCTVSYVSSSWCKVTLNNLGLWNQITLIHCWKKQGCFERMEYMIKRTHNIPLTLCIWVGDR